MKKKKTIVNLDVDSALAVMQEIYNDIAENKANSSLIMKKMLKFMKEAEDMTVIGPVIKDQQKILNDCIEKKISIVKLQTALLKQIGTNNEGGITNVGQLDLTDEDKKILEDLLQEKEGIKTQKLKT